MNRKQAKLAILGAGIVITVGFLLVVGMKRPGGMVYYLTVTEFVQAPERSDSGFKINGKVAEGSISRRAGGMELAFDLSDGSSTLPVRYRGLVPDSFVAGADVVVEGHLGDTGTFEAHTLIAKCPSKYEAADGGAPYGEHPEDIPIDPR